MSDLSLTLTLTEPEQARHALMYQLVPFCRKVFAAGERVALKAETKGDIRSLQQNAFMWAFVLKHISEQALVEGIGATADGWHLYYKRMFLGYQISKVKLPGKKRPSITRELRSTTKLPVSKMSKYLEQVMAHAATTFGVTFPAGERWEDWRA